MKTINSWIIIGIFILCIAFFIHPRAAKTENLAQVGRYQIVRLSDKTAFLLDTTSGQNWVWSSTNDQDKITKIVDMPITVEFKKVLLEQGIMSAANAPSWSLVSEPIH